MGTVLSDLALWPSHVASALRVNLTYFVQPSSPQTLTMRTSPSRRCSLHRSGTAEPGFAYLAHEMCVVSVPRCWMLPSLTNRARFGGARGTRSFASSWHASQSYWSK